MDNQSKQFESDLRIAEAEAVKDILSSKGFQIIQDRYFQIKEQALRDLINEALDDNTLKARQAVYNQICDWINIPERIIRMGLDAVEESKTNEERKETFIKRAIPYLFRK